MDTVTAPEIRYCAECGRPWPLDDLARFGPQLICRDCKTTYTQKLLEGVKPVSALEFAGFWVRVLASIIDSILLMIVQTVFNLFLMRFIMRTPTLQLQPGKAVAAFAVTWLLSITAAALYEGLFVGRYGATPGKMALDLKVVRPDGLPISMGRAFGRHFAKFISSVTLLIGYIMVAFDEERRGLHDMICDTRVIKAEALQQFKI